MWPWNSACPLVCFYPIARPGNRVVFVMFVSFRVTPVILTGHVVSHPLS